MARKIRIKRKVSGTGAPPTLEYGELATDSVGTVYVGNINGTPTLVSPPQPQSVTVPPNWTAAIIDDIGNSGDVILRVTTDTADVYETALTQIIPPLASPYHQYFLTSGWDAANGQVWVTDFDHYTYLGSGQIKFEFVDIAGGPDFQVLSNAGPQVSGDSQVIFNQIVSPVDQTAVFVGKINQTGGFLAAYAILGGISYIAIAAIAPTFTNIGTVFGIPLDHTGIWLKTTSVSVGYTKLQIYIRDNLGVWSEVLPSSWTLVNGHVLTSGELIIRPVDVTATNATELTYPGFGAARFDSSTGTNSVVITQWHGTNDGSLT